MKPRLVVVVGPTAAGKTAVGVALAERLGGEVISADAFAVYRGLDIGTAKPAAAVRARVRHHLVDVADPRERYSAGTFLRDADAAVTDIVARARVPIVVGGTHFYVRALLYGLFREPPKNVTLRAQLEHAWAEDPARLRARLAELDPESYRRIAAGDRQRILRALEVTLLAGRPMSELWREEPCCKPRYPFRMFALSLPREVLHARISQRVEAIFAAGLVQEARSLLESGVPLHAHALKAIGYREACRVVAGEWSEAQARQATVVATRQLAKRQLTWLRGERDVTWVGGDDPVAEIVAILEASGGTGAGAEQDGDQCSG